MASKEKSKKHARNVYFKDATLWGKLDAIAEKKKWSVNQVIQDMVEMQLFQNALK